ncbi:hypothetical protein BDP27DRAFT_1418401 [Rhodocollybia butyracea]|uniref:G domain-containing protein n=1 Tax=Rhodocollybia butyracea TaxID=206335 RepID=A0A9P5PZR9_9AGAR|nr:hypothetical protein BDP27DRAFT_1418401 [Rhodocollybia butyracea]
MASTSFPPSGHSPMPTSVDNSLSSPVLPNISAQNGQQEDLPSSTEEILKSCNRFRILVLGKSGAGKSSLINATFGVNAANVSHEVSGVSNIHREITYEENSKFILHDSQGFVAGETQNYETVRKFITDRGRQRELKDRLHAIWFCMEVPTENGALFKKADETFLALDIKNVPVVVVFTKYDLLVRKFEKEADDNIGDKELDAIVNLKADEFYNKTCVLPLKAITRNRKSPITHVRVSTRRRYNHTLATLVMETQTRLDKYISILWQSAQRASLDEKINGCIAVGKKKYWRSLASSFYFLGKTLQQCLYRIHDDMIDVWNFNDPTNYLKSPMFKGMMARVVDDLYESKHKKKSISFGKIYDKVEGALSPLDNMVENLVGVPSPFDIPIVSLGATTGIVVVQWIFQAYQEIPSNLRLLMGYICDLSSILQCLFWIMQGHDQPCEVKWTLVAQARKEYERTGARKRIHKEIWSFVKPHMLFQLGHKTKTLEKLDSMLQSAEDKLGEPLEKLVHSTLDAQDDQKDEPLEKLDHILQNIRFTADHSSQAPKLSLTFTQSDQFSFDVFAFGSSPSTPFGSDLDLSLD